MSPRRVISRTIRAYESARVLPAPRSSMTDLRRFQRLIGAAAHLCQVESDLVAAGYPELVAELDDLRAAIDLEIAYLDPGDPSQSH